MIIQEFKLQDLCKIRLGYPFRSENYTNEGIPIIRPADIHDEINNNYGALKSTDSKKYERFTVLKGSLLMSLTGISIGKTFIYPFEQKSFHNYNVGCFIIKNENLLRKEYLNILLLGLRSKIVNDYSGNQQPTATASLIEKYTVKIPSIQDQVLIIDIFKRTQDLIIKRKKNMELCDNLGHSLFYNTRKHSLKSHPFQDVIKIQTNLKRKDNDDEADIPVISANDIAGYSGRIEISQKKESTSETSGKSYFTSEHLLYVWKNIEINKIALPDFDGYCNSNIYPILANNILSNKCYVKYVLLSAEFFNHAKKYIESTRVSSINRFIIYNYVVKLPPKKVQDEFSEKIKKVENLASSIEQGLNSLQKLTDYIIKKTFNGKLELNANYITDLTMEENQNLEGDAIQKFNEEIDNFHKSLPNTGAPVEIDNIIRQLDTELKIRGEIPYSDDYVRYRIVLEEFESSFTFSDLWDAISVFPFETIPPYDRVCNLIFRWLKEENPFIRQQFNPETKQIELIINETA